jgi:hypothetical protein
MKLASLFSIRSIVAKIRRAISMILGTHLLWRKLVKSTRQTTSETKPEQPSIPALYFHAHTYQWFQETLPDDWQTDIRCWRFANRLFTTQFLINNFVGRLLLELIFKLETIFPHALAKIGHYPMIIVRK